MPPQPQEPRVRSESFAAEIPPPWRGSRRTETLAGPGADREGIDPMTASRLLAGLLQPLLALLLLAGSPADALSPEARPLVHGIETAPKAIGAQRSGAAIPADTLIEPTRSVNEDGWAGTAVGAKSPLPVRDL